MEALPWGCPSPQAQPGTWQEWACGLGTVLPAGRCWFTACPLSHLWAHENAQEGTQNATAQLQPVLDLTGWEKELVDANQHFTFVLWFL